MCCFTGNVHSVTSTCIFARCADQGRQLLVYSMNMMAGSEVAMVLPIPVPPGSKEDAVRFINLEKDPGFFEQMLRPFVLRGSDQPPIAVQNVGSYEASFLPTRKDFERVDPRFRLPADFWEALPQYEDYGFVVFKLRGEANQAAHFHPMAFEFPRRDPRQLFFPTVHVHDGQVHDHADFDHYLFCQADPLIEPYLAPTFRPSPMRAEEHMNLALAAGVIDAGRCCYFRRLKGLLKNQDTEVSGPDTGAGRSHHFSVHDFPASLHGLLGYTLRVVPPTARITDEYQARRVNLFTDTKGKIFDIVFG